VYITEECGKSVVLAKQTTVKLSPDTRPKLSNTTCRMNLNPSISSSNESGTVLTIQNIRLTPRTAGACVFNSINIYDGDVKLSKLYHNSNFHCSQCLTQFFAIAIEIHLDRMTVLYSILLFLDYPFIFQINKICVEHIWISIRLPLIALLTK
jgi:hypothetical protein